MSKLSSQNKVSANKAELRKRNGKWVASDPASLEAVLVRIKEAKSWSQGQEALITIFTALLKQ